MTEYISYIQTEKLFQAWPLIQGIKESIEKELEKVEQMQSIEEKEEAEYIYTKIVGNKELSDMPKPLGTVSDTTGNIAVADIRKIIRKDIQETRDRLLEEKFYIEMVDDKLNIAFKRLSRVQQRVLTLFYHENKTWAEVLDDLKQDKYFLSKHQAQIKRRHALEKIQRISKITVEMYDYVMKLLEGE